MGNPQKKKYNATGRRDRVQFVKLDYAWLTSPAYRSLSPPARALLVEFSMLFNGFNNGELFLSQRDAADKLNIRTHRTAGKYISELEDRGFIKTKVKGSFNNKTKLASTYILTTQVYNDEQPTKDFMKWKAPKKTKSRGQKTTVTGARMRPSLPDAWPDGSHLPPCSEILAAADGVTN